MGKGKASCYHVDAETEVARREVVLLDEHNNFPFVHVLHSTGQYRANKLTQQRSVLSPAQSNGGGVVISYAN